MITLILEKLKNLFIRSTIKYIVWDFDGTLYQSKKLGHDLRIAYYKLAKTKKPKLTFKIFDLYVERFGSWSAAASKISLIPEEVVLDKIDAKIYKYKYIRSNLNLVNIIESTKNQYHHLILTNSTYQEVILGLNKIGFDTSISEKGPFEKIFARDTTNHLKPNPEFYKEVLKFTKISKFRHIFIGDSYSHDIEPARSLGFQALPIWELSKFFPT